MIVTIHAQLILLSCKDPEYGSKALAFVHKELPALSRDLAAADLPLRWHSARSIGYTELASALVNLSTELQKPDLMPSGDTFASATEALDAFSQADREIGRLITLKRELDELTLYLRLQQSGACANEQIFEATNLSLLGLALPLSAAASQSDERTIYISITLQGRGSDRKSNLLSNLFENMGQWFMDAKRREQDEKLDQAHRLYPSKVIGRQALLELSNIACAESLREFELDYKQLDATLQALRQEVDGRMSVALALQSVAGRFIQQTDLETLLREAGDQRVRLSAELVSGELFVKTELMLNELRLLKARAGPEERCLRNLMSTEQYYDALLEANAQLRALEAVSLVGPVGAELQKARRAVERELAQVTQSFQKGFAACN